MAGQEAGPIRGLRIFEVAARWRLPRSLAYLLLGGVLLSVPFASSHLRIEDSPPDTFPKSHVVWQDIDWLTRNRGWQSDISLVFPEGTTLESIRGVEAAVRRHPIVTAIESPAEVSDFITKDVHPALHPAVSDGWRSSIGGRRLWSESGAIRSLLYLNSVELSQILDLDGVVATACAGTGCHIAGGLVSYAEYNQRVLTTLLSSFAASLALVGGLLYCLMVRFKRKNILRTILPSFWGSPALILVFYVFRIPVFYVTSICASVLDGLTGDNSIQFLYASKHRSLQEGTNEMSSASTLLTFTMILLSFTLFASPFAPLRSLGWLMALGFVLILAGDLWVFQAFIDDSESKRS